MPTESQLFTDLSRIIAETVATSEHSELYHSPLVATVSASHPDFNRLKSQATTEHLLPADLLPNAQTVLAFFLPFRQELTRQNRQQQVARSWASAYIDTNKLIQHICQQLHSYLLTNNIQSAWQKPTHNFDEKKLVAPWSHKSVAYIAGLGTFGLHQMLITPAGSAGRFGSIVLDATLPDHRLVNSTDELCLHYRGKKCLYCVQKCPTGALTEQGFNRSTCYAWLLQVDQQFPDLALSDVCGKCLLGPCAHRIP